MRLFFKCLAVVIMILQFTSAAGASDSPQSVETSFTVSNQLSPNPEVPASCADVASLIAATRFSVSAEYFVIHFIEWNFLQDTSKWEVKTEKWLLYRPGAAPDSKCDESLSSLRIFGSKRIAILAFHQGRMVKPEISYKVKVTHKTPAPIADLKDLAGLVGGAPPKSETPPITLWGGKLLPVIHDPADIVVNASAVMSAAASPLTFSQTYDDEGLYHWDVSIGMPFKTLKELQFNSDGTVTTAKKERTNAYAFLNLFPFPVDVKGDAGWLSWPHLVAGIPISGKPLDRPFVGVGLGTYRTPIKFNLFVGAVFNKESRPQTLNPGDAASPAKLQEDLGTKRVTKLLFGINFPVRQIKDALTKKN